MEEKIEKSQEVNKKHKRASKLIFALAVILAVAIIFSIATALVLLFFPVGEIEVVGDSRYNYSEIIEASGIKNGARLYYLNEERAEEKILSAFPYLESVEIKSHFPNRVKIEIKEFEDIYLVPHISGFCYVNGDFEILEIVKTAPDYDRFSGIFIKLEKCVEGDIGSLCDGEDIKRAKDLIELVKENGFYQQLNIVDVENKYDNSFVVGKKYKFIIGAMTDISEKMDAVFKVCSTDGFKAENNAIINATNKKEIALRYVNDEKIRQEFDFCQK